MPSTASALSKTLPKNTVAAIIPARNEEATVGNIVRRVLASSDCDVVVVDDASSDGTAAAARQAGAHVISLYIRLNAWGAMQTGLRYAVKKGYTTAVTLDSDGQHQPESIQYLLSPVKAGKADVVIGSYPARGSRSRKFAWTFFKRLTKLSFHDLTSGFRVYNRPVMEVLASNKATILDYQDLGVLLLLRRLRFRIVELPVFMEQRAAGKSKVFNSWLTVFRYMIQTIILCMSKFELTSYKEE